MFSGTLCSGDGVEGRKETQDICHAMEREGLRINPSKNEGIGSLHPLETALVLIHIPNILTFWGSSLHCSTGRPGSHFSQADL